MAIDEQIGKARALDRWFNSAQGIALSADFSQELQKIPALTQISSLLQLGVCGDSPWLELFKLRKKWILSPDYYTKSADLVGSFKQIPLESRSLDLVIAPMTMELFGDTTALIDEIDRVLKPMGLVIILGVNTLSLWSLASHMGFFSCIPGFTMKLHSSFLLNRAFVQRGYKQWLLEGFWYLPPFAKAAWIRRFNFLNQMGKIISPIPAGFYYLVAQKLEPGYPAPRIENPLPAMSSALQPLGG